MKTKTLQFNMSQNENKTINLHFQILKNDKEENFTYLDIENISSEQLNDFTIINDNINTFLQTL